MSLNIKNDQTHEQARELAQLTGESLTEAVTTAVRQRWERVQAEQPHTQTRADVLLAIGRDVAGRLSSPARTVDHGELLYDKAGLTLEPVTSEQAHVAREAYRDSAEAAGIRQS